MKSGKRRGLMAWALYDWANSPFTTLIVTFIFPAYFAQAVVGSEVEGQAVWGYANAFCGLVIALLSPVVGAVADAGGRRKPWLLAFTGLCVVASALLWFVEPGRSFIVLAIILSVVANIGFEFGTVFNNAMLPDLVPEDRVGRWSGWAWGLGYMGGLAALLLALAAFVGAGPHLIPLDRSHAEHIRIIGPFVAVWFALFAWPLFLWTPDRAASNLGAIEMIKTGATQLVAALRDVSTKTDTILFLLAHMLYADALVALFAFGGIFAAGTFGMSLAEVTVFGIVLNVTAGLGAFAFGWIDDWIGSRTTILVSLSGLIIMSVGAVFAQDRQWFWIAGSALGLFVGPVQAASRSFMARLAPKGEEAKYFGLFALSGKATAFLGPALVAITTDVSGSQRAGLASLLLLFVVGALVMWRVPEIQKSAMVR